MSKSHTGHIFVPTSCRKDTEAGGATKPVEGVDVSVDISHSFSGEHNVVEFVMRTLSLLLQN